MDKANERRRFWRAAFSAPVTLISDSDSATVHTMLDDISLKGALLELPPEWRGKVGEPCRLSLRLGGAAETNIVMCGRITHIEGARAGFSCDSIDLDSVTHLRRLVELNAGDPQLLERELSALVAGSEGRPPV